MQRLATIYEQRVVKYEPRLARPAMAGCSKTSPKAAQCSIDTARPAETSPKAYTKQQPAKIQ